MSRFPRQLAVLGLLAAALAVQHNAALAASPCKGVDTKLTAQRKSDFARLVAQSLDQNVKPSKITIMGFMQSDTWTIVYADVPVAEPGYFFFDSATGSPVFRDVWGGVALRSEIPEIAKWARNLGANKSIASCFASTVTG